MTATWKFSDGTIVRLGGVVEGDTPLAQELRETLAKPPVIVGLCESGWIYKDRKLNTKVVWQLGCWLDHVTEPYRRECGIKVIVEPAHSDILDVDYDTMVLDRWPEIYFTPEQRARVNEYVRTHPDHPSPSARRARSASCKSKERQA